MATMLKYGIVAVVAVLLGASLTYVFGPAANGQGETPISPQPNQPATAAIQEVQIQGMTCQGCVDTVTAVLKTVPGVQLVKVSLPHKQAILVADPRQATGPKIEAAVAKAGYKAHVTPIAEGTPAAASMCDMQSCREGNDYTRQIARPYKEVLAAVEQAAKAEGFRVSNVHDIAASLSKEGIQHEPYATVEVCNAKLAAQVLQAEPRLGTLMPCRMAVYQQGDKTVVSMVLPSRLMRMFPEKPEVAKAAEKVDHAMKAMVDAATR